MKPVNRMTNSSCQVVWKVKGGKKQGGLNSNLQLLKLEILQNHTYAFISVFAKGTEHWKGISCRNDFLLMVSLESDRKDQAMTVQNAQNAVQKEVKE